MAAFGYFTYTKQVLAGVIFADTPGNVAKVIVQRRWIAYFRAGQRSRSRWTTRPVGEAQE